MARKLPSRLHGPRRVLKELRRLRIKTQRAGEFRAATDDDQRWCRQVNDALDALIGTGEAVLSGGEDPRDRRRVRKRPQPQPLF